MNTHPADLLPINDEGAGLILTPCPGTRGVDAASSLEQLHAAGADALITLMPEAELASNGVSDLAQLCADRGVQWFHLPIEDEHAPEADFAAAWQAQRAAVHLLLDGGKKIAIHCKGGSGRTGLMAAQILLERGCSQDDAVAAVKALRPNALSLAVHREHLLQVAAHAATAA
ncbi:MAG: dual specificity protein phosphatase family protein [Candidatus Accumulibacter sp.]|jgi:protein-tyrosine phosphatase|uniref:protein-tyrosine-phosphatase n=1 Tax=Candidatus Accumulibacter affinis TaxID=2954384 RepID=A0A935W1R9_9PROT|nr:dual specificity protein phosphatase family protein [Candidatus Accumulibacter affinis]